MSEVFDVVLLMALPASGKSEVRNFLANIEARRLQQEFHIGATLQLDDFPYVHMMGRIDEELQAMHQPCLFHRADEVFNDSRYYGALCHLLNEDYHDLLNRRRSEADSAAQLLFQRMDQAAQLVGLAPKLALLSDGTRQKLAGILEKEALEMQKEREEQYPETFAGKTIVIECARGGKDGSTMPLSGSEGYQYSLPLFCPEILSHAAILYIWVTPEESRRKNEARADPNDPGSNLFHGVPLSVMMEDYGCDDMQYLRQHSEEPDTITVKASQETWHLPIGVFDNRNDKTTFLRAKKAQWEKQKVAEVTAGIRTATDAMWKHYQK